MSLFKVFEISGSAMSAQSVRLNTTASNLANAENVSGTPEEAYRSRHPVFAAIIDDMSTEQNTVGVKVAGIVEGQEPPRMLFQPENPLADDNGYVYAPNVNVIEEMANMISASRSYQANVEAMNTTKQLLLRTLQLGQ